MYEAGPELDATHAKGSVGRRPAWWIASQTAAKPIKHLHADLVTAPPDVDREAKAVLVVDPDADVLRAVQYALRPVAHVEACSEFRAARARLLAKPPDLLVTNLRLDAYNGLHLVHLAGALTRCLVYATYDDLILAREAQAAGAFYLRSKQLPFALPSYVNAMLPPRDRRGLIVLDPPRPYPGGRRCTDLSVDT